MAAKPSCRRGGAAHLRIGSLVAALVLAMALVMTPGDPAAAHPGGTDTSGCHTCYDSCESYGLQPGEHHCHDFPSGPPPTEGPPPTFGRPEPSPTTTTTTRPPDTVPPTTETTASGASETSRPRRRPTETTEVPSATEATSTTTTGARLAPPKVSVQISDPSTPEIVVVLQGEPGARYQVTVASTPQTRTGRLDRRGRAEERFTVSEGEHEVRAKLANGHGTSEVVMTSVAVEVADRRGSGPSAAAGVAIVALAVGMAWWLKRRAARTAGASSQPVAVPEPHAASVPSSSSRDSDDV